MGNSGPTAVSDTTPSNVIEIDQDIAKQWADWTAGKAEAEYVDTHCSVFTPASFHLLMTECRALGLTAFEVAEVGGTHGVEFCVRLVRGISVPDRLDPAAARAERTGLLQRVWEEHSVRYSSAKGLSVADVMRVRKDGTRGWVLGSLPGMEPQTLAKQAPPKRLTPDVSFGGKWKSIVKITTL